MSKKHLLLLIIFIFTVIGLKANEPLKVGMELAYPPFEMSDKNGKPTGISVDLAYALGKYLNRKVIIKNTSWDGLIPSLKTGKIDIIISSMTITPKRKKVIDFSIPYARTNLAILTYPGSNIKKSDNLNKKDKVIAVKKGTTGHFFAMDNFKKAKILVFDRENTAVLEVIQKRADAFIYDQLSIYRNWEKHKKNTVALLSPITKQPEYWGIAIKKGNSQLKKRIDTFIKKAKENGTFDQLANKYLKEVKEKFDDMNIPFFF